MRALDRRAFLRTTLAAGGSVALGGCWSSTGSEGRRGLRSTTSLPVDLLPAGELEPATRPVLRRATQDAGPPSPFAYLPTAYQHMTYLYDTLLWQDSKQRLLPWLASRYERSPDGLSYTFQLRDDVRWHDGRPLTAEDVAFSFNYWTAQRDAGHIAPWVIFRPQHVDAARAVGPRTAQVVLDRPIVSFPSGTGARLPIVPRHVWSSIENPFPEVNNLDLLVGSGPYRLNTYRPGRGEYLFTANEDFFLGRPFVREIRMVTVGDELTALRASHIDVGGFQAQATSARVLVAFRADPAYGLVEGSPGFLMSLHWNLAKGGALADARFRQACARAIDRRRMVERLLGGAGHVGNPGFLAPGHPFRVDVQQYPYDRRAANRLLDEAGYPKGARGVRRTPDGQPLRFKLSAPAEAAADSQLVAEDLGAVGIELELAPVRDEFTLGDGYEMAVLFYGGAGGGTDPDILRSVYSSRVKELFFAVVGYANQEFDDLADRQVVTADEAERKELVGRMQQIVAGDLPALPLYYPTPFLIFRRSVIDDQWGYSGDPLNKQVLVTGVGTGGTQIRPIQ